MNKRGAIEPPIIAAASLLLLIAFIRLIHERGGPYLEHPATVMAHAGRIPHDTHNALALLSRVRPLIPRDAGVACFRVKGGSAWFDVESFHTAIAALPDHTVVAGSAAGDNLASRDLVEYAVALREPFNHPSYRIVAEYPEGRLYRVRR